MREFVMHELSHGQRSPSRGEGMTPPSIAAILAERPELGGARQTTPPTWPTF